jgi:hypothetical protein
MINGAVMDHDELQFHINLARKGLTAGVCMAICAILWLLFGHPSTKGYIVLGLWLALIVYGVANALRVLNMGHRIEASGQITDRRNGN